MVPSTRRQTVSRWREQEEQQVDQCLASCIGRNKLLYKIHRLGNMGQPADAFSSWWCCLMWWFECVVCVCGGDQWYLHPAALDHCLPLRRETFLFHSPHLMKLQFVSSWINIQNENQPLKITFTVWGQTFHCVNLASDFLPLRSELVVVNWVLVSHHTDLRA